MQNEEALPNGTESESPNPTMEKSPQKSDSSAATGSGGAGSGSFPATFKAFSKFGDTKSDGKHVTLSQSDKWMKQAKIFDGKKITTTDTGIHFKKQKLMKLNMEQYKVFLEDLAKTKKVDLAEIMNKMANCGTPGLSSAAAAAAGKEASIVDRLTDVSKYTGSHKQRFDGTGKGKGIEGRRDVSDGSGYVHGYQHKDTYKSK